MRAHAAVRNAWGRVSSARVRNIPLVFILMMAAVSFLPAIALANSGVLGTFQSAYPSSTSDNNASCQLCHGSSTSTFNAYGKAVSGVLDPDTGVPDFAAIGSLNSDGDPAGATNIQEINSGTQPGWTSGPNNTLWSRSSGAVTATNQIPPAGITGSLDPAAPTPNTTIDTGPSGTVSSTDATFTFSSTVPGSTFECKLDAGSFASCASPKAYTGLANGSHTFDVRATASGNTDASPASRTWTIDAPATSTTNLSINAPGKVKKGTKVKITGALTSPDVACTNAQQVSLKKGSATIDTASTSATGGYKFVMKIKKKTTVQVTFAGTASCGASASAKKTIKVA